MTGVTQAMRDELQTVIHKVATSPRRVGYGDRFVEQRDLPDLIKLLASYDAELSKAAGGRGYSLATFGNT